MNIDLARKVADTVLYEGYILYPYRASAQKNRSRWQFGVLMPGEFAAADPSERASAQTEYVMEAGDRVSLTVVLRFLQVQRRSVWRLSAGGDFEPVGSLRVDGVTIPAWDEAVEREVSIVVDGATLSGPGLEHPVRIPGGCEREVVHASTGGVVGRLARERRELRAAIVISATPVPGPHPALRLRIRVENRTQVACPPENRHLALPDALVAAHVICAVDGGAFVSMVDAPQWAAHAVAACTNVGLWPVLAGPPGHRDVLLAGPIILYDHPELAPESTGDLYDATEIDEILMLRTLALSDAEKAEARATDPRAAAVIDRTEALDVPTLARLHGTIRGMTPARADADEGTQEPPPWWDPGADASVSPATDAIMVHGRRIARGSRVILRPGARRADAQDMFLIGRTALVEAVLLDVDDNPYLAVTLADDPAADLLRGHGRFLYFAPDEVEPEPAASEPGA
jgi:hypothetical protein